MAIPIYDCYGVIIATFIHIFYPICFLFVCITANTKYQNSVQLYSALRYLFQHCTEMKCIVEYLYLYLYLSASKY